MVLDNGFGGVLLTGGVGDFSNCGVYTLQDRLASRIMENESRILVCHFLRGLWASLLPTPLP